MSPISLAGMTATPSCSPVTVLSTRIVVSRSLPVRRSWSPVSSKRMPLSTGSELPRLVTARPAAETASTSSSRSHRNFTSVLAFPYR